MKETQKQRRHHARAHDKKTLAAKKAEQQARSSDDQDSPPESITPQAQPGIRASNRGSLLERRPSSMAEESVRLANRSGGQNPSSSHEFHVEAIDGTAPHGLSLEAALEAVATATAATATTAAATAAVAAAALAAHRAQQQLPRVVLGRYFMAGSFRVSLCCASEKVDAAEVALSDHASMLSHLKNRIGHRCFRSALKLMFTELPHSGVALTALTQAQLAQDPEFQRFVSVAEQLRDIVCELPAQMYISVSFIMRPARGDSPQADTDEIESGIDSDSDSAASSESAHAGHNLQDSQQLTPEPQGRRHVLHSVATLDVQQNLVEGKGELGLWTCLRPDGRQVLIRCMSTEGNESCAKWLEAQKLDIAGSPASSPAQLQRQVSTSNGPSPLPDQLLMHGSQGQPQSSSVSPSPMQSGKQGPNRKRPRKDIAKTLAESKFAIKTKYMSDVKIVEGGHVLGREGAGASTSVDSLSYADGDVYELDPGHNFLPALSQWTKHSGVDLLLSLIRANVIVLSMEEEEESSPVQLLSI